MYVVELLSRDGPNPMRDLLRVFDDMEEARSLAIYLEEMSMELVYFWEL